MSEWVSEWVSKSFNILWTLYTDQFLLYESHFFICISGGVPQKYSRWPPKWPNYVRNSIFCSLQFLLIFDLWSASFILIKSFFQTAGTHILWNVTWSDRQDGRPNNMGNVRYPDPFRDPHCVQTYVTILKCEHANNKLIT